MRSQPRVIDELTGLNSPSGLSAEGRLYEIPLTVQQFLDEPDRAVELMGTAADMAAEWGAEIVGLQYRTEFTFCTRWHFE